MSWRVTSIHALLTECDSLGMDDQIQGIGFNPRTPYGVRPNHFSRDSLNFLFQSTHSLRSATGAAKTSAEPAFVSIHALLTECDRTSFPRSGSGLTFQSTHSLRSATFRRTMAGACNQEFQSTHSLRSATNLTIYKIMDKYVSIHALLTECDRLSLQRRRRGRSFNPRTPYGVRPSNPSL